MERGPRYTHRIGQYITRCHSGLIVVSAQVGSLMRCELSIREPFLDAFDERLA